MQAPIPWKVPGVAAEDGCYYLEAGELLLLSQSLFDQNTFDALLHCILFCLRTGNTQSQKRKSFVSHFTDTVTSHSGVKAASCA